MDLSKLTREVVKIAKNHIEIRYSAIDKDGNKLPLPDYTETYGQNRITEELAKETASLSRVNNFDKPTEAAIVQARIDELTEIQNEMNNN